MMPGEVVSDNIQPTCARSAMCVNRRYAIAKHVRQYIQSFIYFTCECRCRIEGVFQCGNLCRRPPAQVCVHRSCTVKCALQFDHGCSCPLADRRQGGSRSFGVVIRHPHSAHFISSCGKGQAEVAHAARIPVADVAPLGRRGGRILDPICVSEARQARKRGRRKNI